MAKTRTQKHSPAKARPSRRPDWPIVALALLGIAITGYLTVVAWLDGGAALCTAGSGCDVIQQSRWSSVLGLPLALWGLAVYALLAGLAWRGSARLKDWQRLWTLALLALVISLYLTLVGLWSLGAVCIWCLASLVVLVAIFAALTVRRPASAPGAAWSNWLINRGVIAVLLVGALHFYYHYDSLLARAPDERLQALAEHLERTGAKYYGAFWCVNCQRQHSLFGPAKEQLPYVECSPDGRQGIVAPACRRARVQSYPTWIIEGERYEGVQQPQALARYSGFPWSAEKD